MKLVTVPTDVGNLELDDGRSACPVGKGKYEDSTGGASKSKAAKVIKEKAEEHTTPTYINAWGMELPSIEKPGLN